MHDSAYRIGELVMRTYSDLANAKVLEIGSLNINGCLRDVAAPTTNYVGLDFKQGPSVDMVVAPGDDYPVENGSFDLVMASSVFEHDPRFWDTFLQMCRAARRGGHIYINAPANGTVHRYPLDCWRFYPDAGMALADYARLHGLEIDLVESFTGQRHSDVWNDFVAIFRKGPTADPLNTAFVYQRYPCSNVRTWQSASLINPSQSTEDMLLLNRLQQQVAATEGDAATIDSLKSQVGQLEQALNEERQQQQSRDDDMQRLSAALIEAQQISARSDADKSDLIDQSAVLRSHLAQRQEEVAQAWLRVRELQSERDGLLAEVKQLDASQSKMSGKLIEAEKWVFDLAAQRRTLENRLQIVDSALTEAQRCIANLKRDGDTRERQLNDHREVTRAYAAGAARVQKLAGNAQQIAAQAHDLHLEWREKNHPLTDLAAFLRDTVASEAVPSHDSPVRAGESSVDSAALVASKAALHSDVEKLVARLADQEKALFDEQARVSQLNETISALRAEALGYHAKASAALEQLEVLRSEHGQQARRLRAAEDKAAKKDSDLMWMRRLFQLIEYANAGWRGLVPPALRRFLLARTLQRKQHFDGQAYLEKYADVAAAGMDPLRHYVNHGMAEGRFVDING